MPYGVTIPSISVADLFGVSLLGGVLSLKAYRVTCVVG
jgi:hypothetical protein